MNTSGRRTRQAGIRRRHQEAGGAAEPATPAPTTALGSTPAPTVEAARQGRAADQLRRLMTTQEI